MVIGTSVLRGGLKCSEVCWREQGDEIEEPVWQPESWWLFTGSDILVDQARKEWELLDKGFYTVAAELTNKFGKKFYKFI